MTYKKLFNLNRLDIDVIETCLRKELRIRSEKYREPADRKKAGERDCSRQGISEITELLGKIHNQKIWYNGDPAKPWVPKG